MKFSALMCCVLATPVLALSACSVSIDPPVQSTVQKTFFSEPAMDGYVYSNNGITGWGTSKLKDIRVGDNQNDASRRGILSFSIGEIPAGAQILEATVVVAQAAPKNTPYVLGPNMLVDHVDLQGTLDKTDYESAPLHAAIGVLSTNGIPGARTLDVRDAVQSDVNAGRTSSEYRLWFPAPTNGDGMSDTAKFNDAGDDHGNGLVPTLIVKWTE